MCCEPVRAGLWLAQICVASQCVPAYGHDYRFRIIGATLPETNSTGSTWDFPGGLPDAYVLLSDGDGNECRTGYIDNTLTPTWNHECDSMRVHESSRFRWRVYDVDDISDNEYIGGTPSVEAFQIEVGWIKDGAFSDSRGSVDIEFGIEPM